MFPDCLDRLEVEKISFLHIDLNTPKPEIAALSLLWGRLVKGVCCYQMTTVDLTEKISTML